MVDDRSMRLAFREEGYWWNAYVAEIGTMEGAVLLGSIAMAAVREPSVKEQFMETMKVAFGAVVGDLIGGQVTWPNPPQAAPEHERAGKA